MSALSAAGAGDTAEFLIWLSAKLTEAAAEQDELCQEIVETLCGYHAAAARHSSGSLETSAFHVVRRAEVQTALLTELADFVGDFGLKKQGARA